MAWLYGVFLVYPKSVASWSCLRPLIGALALGVGGVVPLSRGSRGCCTGPAAPDWLSWTAMGPVVEAGEAGGPVAGEAVLQARATAVGSRSQRGWSGESSSPCLRCVC